MQISEVALFTNDVDAAAGFYERFLGVKPVHRGDGIAVFRVGDVRVLVHGTCETGPDDVPCENHVAFAVVDVDQTVAGLTARGLPIEIPPRDFDWGRSAYLRDPDGHLVEIQQAAE